MLFLPTYAATAWYHQRLANVLQKMELALFLAEVEEFALGEYNSCLLYTSDAADERSSVDLGGRRIIKKKKKEKERQREVK